MLSKLSHIALIITILLASCKPTQESKYKIFEPEDKSYFHITFEYPSDWIWEHPPESDREVSSDLIKLSDPEWRAQTEQSESCYKGGQIQISVYVGDTEQLLEWQLQAMDFGINTMHALEVISDKEIQIDSRTSRSMVLRQKPYELEFCQSEAQTAKIFFLPSENELYIFYFSASENEQNTKFAEAFTHILDTVKIEP